MNLESNPVRKEEEKSPLLTLLWPCGMAIDIQNSSRCIKHTIYKLFEAGFEQLVVHPKPSRMLDRGQWVFDDIFDVDVDPNLM